jgi:hypothetical protein
MFFTLFSSLLYCWLHMFEAARSFHISSRSAIMYVAWRNNYSPRSEIIVDDFVLSHRHLFLIEENTYYMLSNQHESKKFIVDRHAPYPAPRLCFPSAFVATAASRGSISVAGKYVWAAAESCGSILVGVGLNGNSGKEGWRIWVGVSGWSAGEKERDICSPEFAPS